MLVFAGAATAVLALAIPLVILFQGPGGDVVATTTTVAQATSTVSGPDSTTTSTPSETTTTPAVETVWSGVVYLYQSPESSFTANPVLVPVALELTDLSGALGPDNEFTAALTALGPELAGLGNPLSNAVPAEVAIVSRSVGDTTTVVDMNEAFLDGAGGLLADVTMLNQLIYTLTQQSPDSEVQFTVNAEPVTAYGSEGLDLTQPVNRDSFLEDLGVIFLTDPLIESDGSYRVSGRANTFEASLTVLVIDMTSGETVHEEHITATSGSGIWGEFTLDIPGDLITPGATAIQLLDYSAKDGAPENVVTVPIPAGDVWVSTIGS